MQPALADTTVHHRGLAHVAEVPSGPLELVQTFLRPRWSFALAGDGETMLIGGEKGTSSKVYAGAESFTEQALLTGAQGQPALSGDGDTALVGNGQADDGVGVVEVFTRTEGSWTKAGEIESPNPTRKSFGSALALAADGQTAVVGGGGGPSYLYQRDGEAWNLQATFETSSSTGAVAISGDGNTVVIGQSLYLAKKEKGAASVYTRSGSEWTQSAKLLSGTGKTTYFGETVAISEDGSTILVGSPFYHGTLGAVWAFGREGSSWIQQSKFEGRTRKGKFGASLALSGNGEVALIGTEAVIFPPGEKERLHEKVTKQYAYVLERSGSAWSQREAISGEITREKQRFGNPVALSSNGQVALIGRSTNAYPGEPGTTSTSVYRER